MVTSCFASAPPFKRFPWRRPAPLWPSTSRRILSQPPLKAVVGTPIALIPRPMFKLRNPLPLLVKVPTLIGALLARTVSLETSVLTPMVLLMVPACLTLWAMVELGYWRLTCRPRRGQAPFRLLRHYVLTCLPMLILSVGWSTRGRHNVALLAEHALRIGAAWCLWQWPEHQAAVDRESSEPLRLSTRVWRYFLSIVGVGSLVLRLFVPAVYQPLLAPRLLSLLPARLSQPWSIVGLRILAWVSSFYFLLVFLPTSDLFQPVLSRNMDDLGWRSAFRLNEGRRARAQPPWLGQVVQEVKGLYLPWRKERRGRSGMYQGRHELLFSLMYGNNKGEDRRDKVHKALKEMMMELQQRSSSFERRGDMWKEWRRTLDRRKQQEQRRREQKEAKMAELRRQLASRTLTEADRQRQAGQEGGGKMEEEEEEEGSKRRERLKASVWKVTFDMGPTNSFQKAFKGDELVRCAPILTLLMDTSAMLERPPVVDDLAWFDWRYGKTTEEVLRNLVVRYWIEADKASGLEQEKDEEGVIDKDRLAELAYGGKFLRDSAAQGGAEEGTAWDFEGDGEGEEDDAEEDGEEEGADRMEAMLLIQGARQRRGEVALMNLEDGTVMRMTDHDAMRLESMGEEDAKLEAEYPCPDGISHIEDGPRRWRRYVRRWLRWNGKDKGQLHPEDTQLNLLMRSSSQPPPPATATTKASYQAALACIMRGVVRSHVLERVKQRHAKQLVAKDIPQDYLLVKLTMAIERTLQQQQQQQQDDNATTILPSRTTNTTLSLWEATAALMGGGPLLAPTSPLLSAVEEEMERTVQWDGDEEAVYAKFRQVRPAGWASFPDVDVASRKDMWMVLTGMMPGVARWLYRRTAPLSARRRKRRTIENVAYRKYREDVKAILEEFSPAVADWLERQEEGEDLVYEYKLAMGNKWKQRTWKRDEEEPPSDEE